MFKPRDLHVIVLAGDENPRLIPLSKAVSGMEIPKQLAFIVGDGSLLQQTVAAYAEIAPPERIDVVVSQSFEDLARTQLRQWRGIGLLARPADKGPAIDLLLALGRVLARNPNAMVLVAPAHHYVPNPSALVTTMTRTLPALSTMPVIVAGAVMNGVTAGDSAIIPGPPRRGRVMAVKRLVVHTTPAQAQRLKAEGALWDTSTCAATAAELWHILAAQLPTEAAIVRGLWGQSSTGLSSVSSAFRYMPDSASSATLWRGGKSVGVVPVHGTGWSAWSSPEQVMDSIRDPHDLESVLSRIYQRQQALDRAQLRRRFRAEGRRRDAAPECLVRNSYLP